MPQFNIKQVKGSTQGSVLFLGTNARVSEDSSRFSWDITNSSLLLGTNSIFGTERLRVYGNQRIDGDLFITGSFSVLGSTSVINTQNLSIQDPIILLASTQSGSPILDSGLFINRGTGATQAFIWDESVDEFVFIQTNDSSTVIGDVNISSYANIRANGATFAQIKITSGASNEYVLVSDSTGLASWTSSVPNGVTGSGVVNYVPRWLSLTNLSATGSIYDDGNFVGINSTSPTSNLYIKGYTTGDYSPSLIISNSSSQDWFYAYNNRKLIINGGSGDNEWFGIAQPVAGVGDNTVFTIYAPSGGGTGRIVSAFNDGTGTDNSGRHISFIDGGVRASYLFSTGRSCLSLNSAGGTYQLFSNSSGVSRDHIAFINGAGGGLYLDQDASQYYRLYMIGISGSPTNWMLNSDGDSWLALTSTQKVGIGVVSPTTKLHIYATQSGGGFRLEDTTQAAGYFLVSDANGVGSWTEHRGLVNANNGLTYSGGIVQLGGPLIQDTKITNTSNIFTMSSTSDIYFKTIDGTGTSLTKLSVEGVSGTVSSVLISEPYAYISSTDTVNTTSFLTSPAYLSMDTGTEVITMWTSNQIGGDGSTNNRMTITDGSNAKGLVYAGSYSANFTTYSLVTKEYVDSVVGASGGPGTGTVNYVPYWTTSTQLSSTSSIIDSGNEIGIGTQSNATYKVNIQGDVNILGTLYATSKSFEITHPLDPSKRLTYGSLEGPEYGVYFRGKLERNNIIDLPNYWIGLVDETTITVNITPIGIYQRIFVDKIENNKVYLGVDNSGPPNCYYIVYAERKDIPKIIVE